MKTLNRPKTGIVLAVKDLSKLKEAATEWAIKRDATIESCGPRLEIACARTRKGKLAILCTEGVGETLPMNATYEVDCWADYKPNEDGSRNFGMFPITQINVKASEFEALPTARLVALEDFVRTFGRRLEENFELWRKELK